MLMCTIPVLSLVVCAVFVHSLVHPLCVHCGKYLGLSRFLSQLWTRETETKESMSSWVPAGSESGRFRAGKLSLWGIPVGRVQEQDFPEDMFYLPCLWSVMKICSDLVWCKVLAWQSFREVLKTLEIAFIILQLLLWSAQAINMAMFLSQLPGLWSSLALPVLQLVSALPVGPYLVSSWYSSWLCIDRWGC